MSKDKKNNIKDLAFTLEVGSDVVERVRKGDITRLCMDINENNQDFILENVGGNLALITEELPNTFHGCYFYNGGVFPYAFKDTLKIFALSDGKEEFLVRIINIDTEAGTRFNYQGAGKPIVEDPNGDSCVWEVQFDIVPILLDAKTYLMRWNPSISSFTEKNFEECVANMKNGMFFMDWSIREWEEACRGDFFYMMRVGDDKAGIVFNGQFLSDPYVGDDWGGSPKRRLYVDMVCMNPVKPGTEPLLSLNTLQKTLPQIDWANGPSGVLLPKELEGALDSLWNGG